MTLQIGAITESGWFQLLPLWAAMGWNSENKDEVEHWYVVSDGSRDATTLLIHARAEVVIARLIQQGMLPTQALKHWQQQAEAMLSYFKANRRTTRLIDRECLHINSEEVDALCDDLSIMAPVGKLDIEAASTASPDPLYLLLAAHLVNKHPTVKKLMVQLEACTLPLGESTLPEPRIDIDAVLADVKKQRQDLQERVAEIHRLREELKAAETALGRVTAELNEAKERDKNNALKINGLEEDGQLLLEQLRMVQDEYTKHLLAKPNGAEAQSRKKVEKKLFIATEVSQKNPMNSNEGQAAPVTGRKRSASLRALFRPFKRTTPEKRKLKKQIKQLLASSYFDADWYLKTYPDVAENNMNAAEHYLKFGASEGRKPSDTFDTQWYLNYNPDVQESGINPLIHFLNHGQSEGRLPNPNAETSAKSAEKVK